MTDSQQCVHNNCCMDSNMDSNRVTTITCLVVMIQFLKCLEFRFCSDESLQFSVNFLLVPFSTELFSTVVLLE